MIPATSEGKALFCPEVYLSLNIVSVHVAFVYHTHKRFRGFWGKIKLQTKHLDNNKHTLIKETIQS